VSPLVVLIDGLCLRCDFAHTSPCMMSDEDFSQTARYQELSEASSSDEMIHAVRMMRARRVLQ
jgi:hypothetical protein